MELFVIFVLSFAIGTVVALFMMAVIRDIKEEYECQLRIKLSDEVEYALAQLSVEDLKHLGYLPIRK